MRGFKSKSSATRFCRSFDELRNFLRPRSNRNQHVPASHRRLHILSRSPDGDQHSDGRVTGPEGETEPDHYWLATLPADIAWSI
jgi:hypothetical protein